MNPESGRVYWTPEDVQAAQERGEPLVEVTPENLRQAALLPKPRTVPLSRGQYRRLSKAK